MTATKWANPTSSANIPSLPLGGTRPAQEVRQNITNAYGEVAELAEGARLLSECTGSTCTEGSNPSLSAIP